MDTLTNQGKVEENRRKGRSPFYFIMTNMFVKGIMRTVEDQDA